MLPYVFVQRVRSRQAGDASADNDDVTRDRRHGSGRSEEADLLEMGLDDAGKCLDERSGRVEHGRPLEADAFLSRQFFELDVDVVLDLDMIRNEADRRQQDLPMPRVRKFP